MKYDVYQKKIDFLGHLDSLDCSPAPWPSVFHGSLIELAPLK